MNDSNMGRVEGLMISLLIAEKNKKHPERIKTELLEILHDVSIEVADMAIQNISFEAEAWVRTHK